MRQSCRQIRIYKNKLAKILVSKPPVTRIKKRLADKGTGKQAGTEEERQADIQAESRQDDKQTDWHAVMRQRCKGQRVKQTGMKKIT